MAMNISLTPELEQFVDAKVASGRYGSASEVVREALRLLWQEEDDKARLRQEIETAWLASRTGGSVDGPAAMAALRARLDAKAKRA